MAAFVTLFTVIIAVTQRDTLTAGLAGLAVTYSLQVRDSQKPILCEFTCSFNSTHVILISYPLNLLGQY